jgi:PAS domain S-box-containing protein
MKLDDQALHRTLLDSMREGIYATDMSRRIIYWSQGAERIMGWTAEDIVGRHCYDGILCHVDKDGHRLCGEEHCPLHRSICTKTSSEVPIIIFGQAKDGRRVPLQVSVSPLRDADGKVIGGVETFRDLSHEFSDMERLRKIQKLSMQQDLPLDERIRFSTRYVPRDVIGGDYYSVVRLDDDRFGFLLADVAGHGISAALYTMCLSSLWNAHHHLLMHPGAFARTVNERLRQMVERDSAFAAALCGLFDLQEGVLRLTGAGNPGPLVIRPEGQWERPAVEGFPLGLMHDAAYGETTVPLRRGDCVLLFTDGILDVPDRAGKMLGIEGLIRILQKAGYPACGPAFESIEERMLRASDRIRFDDDITFIEARMIGEKGERA